MFELPDVTIRFRPTVHPEDKMGTSASELASPLVTTIAGAVTIEDLSAD